MAPTHTTVRSPTITISTPSPSPPPTTTTTGHSPRRHHDTVHPAGEEEAIPAAASSSEEPVTGTMTVTASNGYAYGSLNPSLPSPPSNPSVAARQRALAPDLLRGLLVAFMALDHNTVGLDAWRHSTGPDGGESDSAVVNTWTWWLGYTLRTLSHLCAPGFIFLLGMGVVYFGQSRAKLAWSSARMARHFVLRGVVLTFVSVVMGFVLFPVQLWFTNVVLVALAVNYVLVGLLWLGIAATEPALARLLDRFVLQDDDDGGDEDDDGDAGRERRPLITTPPPSSDSKPQPSHRADELSWHFHNTLLLVLSFVTIWWNHWLSETHGTCTSSSHTTTTVNTFWRFWFFVVVSPHVISTFPPLAWLSFAILGLLYARIIVSRPSWSSSVPKQVCGNVAPGLAFFLLFILTRILRIGNLSEGCLQTPEHVAHPNANPYLTSSEAFFYIVKYPPDFAFFNFTLACTFLLLALLTAIPARFATKWLPVLLAYGTSALFFYVVHLRILTTLCPLWINLVGHDTGRPSPVPGEHPAKGVDNLAVWFLNWALVMAVMYPLCKWYSAFKKRRGAHSVWRFF